MFIQGVNALPTKWNAIFFPRNHLACPELMQSSKFLSQNVFYKNKKRRIDLPCLTLKAQDASLLLWVTWKHPWHFHLSPVATALSHSTEKVNSSGCVAHFSWLSRNDQHCSPETPNPPHGLHSEYKCYLIYLLNTQPRRDLIKHL